MFILDLMVPVLVLLVLAVLVEIEAEDQVLEREVLLV